MFGSQWNTDSLRIWNVLQMLQYVHYNGAYLKVQYITSQTMPSTIDFREFKTSNAAPSRDSPVQGEWNFMLSSITWSKYPVALKHILQCSKLCCYADFCLNCQTCSTRLVWLFSHCKMCSKCLVWLHMYDYNRNTLVTSIWKNVPLMRSKQYHTYCSICYSLSLVCSVFGKDLQCCWWEDHCNGDAFPDICFE